MSPSSPQDRWAQRVIRWPQKLTVTEGSLAGQPLKLVPFQRRFIYGVMRNSEAALSIARGNGKTTGATIRAIGSDPRRTHGLAPVLVIADEPAQWPVNYGTSPSAMRLHPLWVQHTRSALPGYRRQAIAPAP